MNTMPPLQAAVRLAPMTTLKVGGAAEWYGEAHTEKEVAAIAVYAKTQQIPLTILAGGSNVLVSDDGLSGVVLRMQLKGVVYHEDGDTVLLTAAAGEDFDTLVADTVQKGYWGLENMSHIPGSVGATPIQNVGAYGVETSDVVAMVRVYDRTLQQFAELDVAACRFGYRDSIFKQAPHRYIVTAVTYRLTRTPKPMVAYQGLQAAGLTEVSSLVDIRDAVIAIRAGKFPDWHVIGTAGSFFTNPVITGKEAAALQVAYPELPVYPAADGRVKVSLGYILDKVCGLRGLRDGNVELFQNQALVLVAHEGATARSVEAFATRVATEVQKKTGIQIEYEVTRLGA